MNRMVLIGMMLAAGLPQMLAQSAYNSEMESKLMSLERLVRVQALPNGDFTTLNSILADEFVLVTSEGRLQDKREWLAYVQGLDAVHYAIQDMIVRVHGDAAIVTGRFQMSGVERGKPFVRQGRFVDTCLNSNGRWLIISSLSTPAS